MINYEKLTEKRVDTIVKLRIKQLRDEGATEEFDLVPNLLDFYRRHLADGSFVSWLAVDGERVVGTSGMSFVEKPPYFGCPTGRIGLLLQYSYGDIPTKPDRVFPSCCLSCRMYVATVWCKPPRTKRPSESQPASYSFAAFDLRRLNRERSCDEPNRLNRQ